MFPFIFSLILYNISHFKVNNFTCVIVSAYQKDVVGFRFSAQIAFTLSLVIFNTNNIIPFHNNVKILKDKVLQNFTTYYLTLNNNSCPNNTFIAHLSLYSYRPFIPCPMLFHLFLGKMFFSKHSDHCFIFKKQHYLVSVHTC